MQAGPLLPYRSAGMWKKLIGPAENLPKPLEGTELVQEQYPFALNRQERDDDVQQILLYLISRVAQAAKPTGLSAEHIKIGGLTLLTHMLLGSKPTGEMRTLALML